MNTSKPIVMFSLFIGLLFWAGSVLAIPAFARKYDKPCSTCHTAWPQLNRAGRMFKEAGYQFPSDPEKARQISDFLYLDKGFPISAVLAVRPYDKKDSGAKKVRAMHEIEIIAAGVLGKQWSGYFEIEAEDETNFDPEFSPAVLSYQYNQALNLQFVWGPALWADPYGLLGDHFRLTRGRVKVIDETFGGADKSGKLRTRRQNVSLTGRPMDRLFYSIGLGGEASDAEGVNASNTHGRLAFDITRDIMVGAFIFDGETEEFTVTPTTTPKRKFERRGVDAMADIGNLRVQAAIVKAEDDNAAATAKVKNDAWSVQGIYVMKSKRRPTWVPVVRYDVYEQSAGVDEYKEITLNLTRYFTENVKGYVEYWDQLDAPSSVTKDKRLTLQGVVAF